MFDKKKIDIKSLFKYGYCVTTINKEYADKVLNELKKETWISVDRNDDDFAEGVSEKGYTNRYVSAQGVLRPNKVRNIYKKTADLIQEWSRPVLDNFAMGDCFKVIPFCGVNGYSMESHSDAGDRAILIAVAYFGDDMAEEDGGTLDFHKTNVAKHYDLSLHHFHNRVIPSHGKVVIFNALSPLFYHSVNKLIKPGVRRYNLFINFGLNLKEDHDFEYIDKPGFIHSDEKCTSSEPEKIPGIIKRNDSKKYPIEDILFN